MAEPTLVYGDEFVGFLLISFIILLFWIVMMAWVKTTPAITVTEIRCSLGQCATNLYTGVKRCPSTENVTILADPEFEVCNSKIACDNESTEFAVQPDGSTNLSGLCAKNDTCSCVRSEQCANYLTSKFSQRGGNILKGSPNQPLVLEQTTTYQNILGDIIYQPPLVLQNAQEICTVPPSWLKRIWPRECLAGTLAYIDSDGTFDQTNDKCKTPIGCVLGETCYTSSGSIGVGIYNALNATYKCDETLALSTTEIATFCSII